jgi:hypothetical protein
MKLFFSFILISSLSSVAQASEAVLLTFNENQQLAKTTSEILSNKFFIPKNLIALQRKRDPCHQRKDVIIHLCFENNKMKILYVNEKEKKEKLGVFYED